MPMPVQWLGSCKLQCAATAPRPLGQQHQQQQQAVHSSSAGSSSSSSRVSTSCNASSSTHRHAAGAAAAAAAAAPAAQGSCSSSSSSLHPRASITAAAAAAAAGAFPLPDPSSFQEHSRSSIRHNSGSSNSSAHAGVAASAAAAAAAVDALSGPLPPQGWQISTHIRQSVEEAMKASMTGMGFVHLPPAPPGTQQRPPQQQQQQQPLHQQQQHEQLLGPEEQPSPQQQQQHASWQQLVQEMGRVEAQHSTAGLSTAVDDSTGTAGPSSSSTTSSSVLLPKSTQQIQACRSAAALEVLLQQSWQQMDHVHIASAFVQLARIQQRQQQQQGHQASPEAAAAAAAVEPGCMSRAGWSMLQQVALQQLDQLQSRQVSNILWACGSCSERLKPSDALIQGLLARSQTLLRQGTTPQGFANMLWGLASLRVQPRQEWLGMFFEASQQQLLNFQPQELSSTIWALAQLRQAPPREWYGAFLTASAAKLGACSAQSLCNLLWGVARLGLAVPEHWWCALTYACSVRAAELSPAGVCQVLWGAGMVAGKQQRQRQQQQQQQLDASTPQEQSASQQAWGYVGSAAGTSSSSGLGAAAAAVPAGMDSTAWLQPLLAAVGPRLQELSGAAVSCLLWALAVLGHNPGAAFVSRSLSCCNASQGGLTASNSVHALWAVTCLGEQQEAGGWGVQELQPLLGQLQQQGMQGCKPQEFVYAAAALASLSKQQQQQVDQVQSAQPGAQQQQQQHQEQQSAPLLPPLPLEAAPHSLSLSASGESLRPTAAGCTLDSMAQQLLSASKPALQQFHLGQLCQLGRWLVAAGVRPDASWVAAFLAATAPHLHMLQPGQQLLLLHAVQHWGSTVVQQQPGWVALLLAACTSELALQGYTATHVGALLQAFAAAKLQPQPHHLQQLLQRMLQPDAALDTAAVAGVLSGLFSLGFRPPNGWVQQLWGAAAAAVLRAGPEGLAAVAAVLQDPRIWELSLRPNRPFAAAFQAGIAAALPHLQPQQAAALLAGLTAAGIKPGRTPEQLLPGLMAAAVKGLYSMPLCDVVAAWWGLVRPKVLNSAVPLEQLQVAPPAAAAQQDQQWLQQQWQALWLRRVFSSPGAVQQLAQLPAPSLLQLADCIRRLQQQVPSSWADTYIAAVSVHIPGLKAHELHLLLHALPCLEGAAAMPQFACTLLAASEPLLQSFSPSQLSDILTSIQSAGLRPPEPWLKGYVAAAAMQLGQFWPRQLTHVLTSLARLRFMPDAAFLSAATEAAVNHLPKYRVEPGEMVNLLWAIVALRVRPSAAWMVRFEARLLERGPEQLDGQQLSRLGWCLSALQRKPGRVLWAKWLAATQAQMPVMDSSSLSDTLWSCAMLDEQPSRAWLDTFTSSSQQHLQTLSSSSLVTVVWSLALLQHRPPGDWMLACFAALSQCFEATAAAVAAGSSHSGDAQQQQQRAEHAVEPLGSAQVTRLTWALAALDCQLPADLSAQLLQLCLLLLPQLDSDSLAQCVWAWDRLDASQDKQLVRQVAAAARAQLMPHASFNSILGSSGLLQGPSGYVSSAGSSSSSSRSSRPGDATGTEGLALQRPAVRVRLGQQRVVVRHSSGSSAAMRAVAVVSQQQQQQVAATSSAQGLLGFSPQRALFGGGRMTAGTKQQLMATLQRLYAADAKPNSSSSLTDAEVSVV